MAIWGVDDTIIKPEVMSSLDRTHQLPYILWHAETVGT
jgi:hypothetical protein